MIIKLRNFRILNSIEKFIVKADGIVVSQLPKKCLSKKNKLKLLMFYNLYLNVSNIIFKLKRLSEFIFFMYIIHEF